MTEHTGESSGWGLVLSFIDQSQSFCTGFACGQIWQQMTMSLPKIESLILDAGGALDQIRAMANQKGYSCEPAEEAHGWFTVTMHKVQPERDTSKPDLKVVP